MTDYTRAACVGVPDNVFFPEEHRRSPIEARRICYACPVRLACLDECMRAEAGTPRHSRHGIYGGLTPTERSELAKKRARHA